MCDGNEESKEIWYRQSCVAEEQPLCSSVLITDSCPLCPLLSQEQRAVALRHQTEPWPDAPDDLLHRQHRLRRRSWKSLAFSTSASQINKSYNSCTGWSGKESPKFFYSCFKKGNLLSWHSQWCCLSSCLWRDLFRSLIAVSTPVAASSDSQTHIFRPVICAWW